MVFTQAINHVVSILANTMCIAYLMSFDYHWSQYTLYSDTIHECIYVGSLKSVTKRKLSFGNIHLLSDQLNKLK